MAKKLWSVFTDDMDHCMFTGSNDVERHHIYGGWRKKLSEKYGFIAPLRPDIHPNGVHFNPPPGFKDIDYRLKMMSLAYYLNHIGSEEDFVEEFGRTWR